MSVVMPIACSALILLSCRGESSVAPTVLPPVASATSITPAVWLAERGLSLDTSVALVGSRKTGKWEHFTRESLWYVQMLLASPDSGSRALAERIVPAVLALQDHTPTSRYFGLWPKSAEVPLGSDGPPDLNWAEFNCTALLNIIDLKAALAPSVVDSIDAAVLRAVRFFQNRAHGPRFHNIHALAVSSLVRAAVRYSDPVITSAANRRIDSIYKFLVIDGQKDEYASPTYNPVSIDALGKARNAAQVLGQIQSQHLSEALAVLCRELAQEYSREMGEVVAPHSRAYDVTMGAPERRDLERVLFGAQASCGEVRLPSSRSIVDTFLPPLSIDAPVDPVNLGGVLPVIGTSSIESGLLFGAVSVGGFWSQHRPLLAVVGTRDRHGYMRMRVLADGYDLAAAQFFSAQRGAAVLAGVTIADDGGSDHPDHYFAPGGPWVRDLRIRFEFGGDVTPSQLALPTGVNDAISVLVGDHLFEISAPLIGSFGSAPRWTSGSNSKTRWLDLVLLESGTTVTLRRSTDAVTVLTVSVDDSTARGSKVQNIRGVIDAQWNGLRLRLPSGTSALQTMHQQVRGLLRAD